MLSTMGVIKVPNALPVFTIASVVATDSSVVTPPMVFNFFLILVNAKNRIKKPQSARTRALRKEKYWGEINYIILSSKRFVCSVIFIPAEPYFKHTKIKVRAAAKNSETLLCDIPQIALTFIV